MRALARRFLRPRCVVCELKPANEDAGPCPHCEADYFPTSASRVRCSRCAIALAGADTQSLRVCGRCLAQSPCFDETLTLADYAAPIDGMIMAMKFGGRLDLAAFFGRLLALRWASQPGSESSAFPHRQASVMAVPLSFERVQQRGFNQSQHIARAFCAAGGHRLNDRPLVRVRDTAPQLSLAFQDRQRNVKGAFAMQGAVSNDARTDSRNDLQGASITVIDDVMTTGSTLNEIARVLKQAGAARVVNVVVARTP